MNDDTPSPPKKKKKKKNEDPKDTKAVHRVNHSHSDDLKLPTGTAFRTWHLKAKELKISNWPTRPALHKDGREKVGDDSKTQMVPICLRYQITGACTVPWVRVRVR